MAATGLQPNVPLYPSNAISAGVPSATPGQIPVSTPNPGTDAYRLYNPANRIGNGSYAGPVAIPDNGNIGNANAGFNQAMMEISQHFDPMIQISVLQQPRWWHDRIPRTAYKLFNGTVHETRIFRGALMKYAGLSEWKDIDPYPTATNNPCGAMGFNTPTYGWEAISWRGKRSAWGSDPICADQFKFFDQAQQQLAWILATGAEYGIQMQEVWNRDMFVYQSVVFNRSFIMSSEYTGKPDNGRYFYGPFIAFDGEAGGSEGHADPSEIDRPFILFDAAFDVQSLNFDVLDKVRASLEIRCPDAAVSSAGGQRIFAIAISHDDVEKYVRGNEEERKYWIEANPQALIKHYDFTTPVFRRWSIINDGNQLRFKRTKILKNASESDLQKYGLGPADIALFAGKDVWVAVAVDPLIASTTRVGVNNTVIPEDNPEYIDAELAIAPVFMNQIFENQMVPSVTTLGSGTSFGPAPGLNGTWRWINILDRETNPLGNVGNFYGTFEIVPKPNKNVFHTISFLYKRCTVALPSFCPSDNTKINPSLKDSTVTVGAVAFQIGDTSAVIRTKDMLKASPGDAITLTTYKAQMALTGAGTLTGATLTSCTFDATTGKWTLAYTVDTTPGTLTADGTGKEETIVFKTDTAANYATVAISAGSTSADVNAVVYGAPTANTLEVQFDSAITTERKYLKDGATVTVA